MMALVVDQQSNGYKHFCKICNKGFMCGRALGGHMRTHGIGDHSFYVDDDDDPVSADWDSCMATHASTGTNHINNNIEAGGNNGRMYALRTNTNRLNSCRTCENCGKEFSSWKSLLEHGKCGVSDELDESLASSLGGSEYYDDEDNGDDGRRGCRWSKRKRSMCFKVDNFGLVSPTSEEEDLANCLMMLSSGMVDIPPMAEPEESCASASRDKDHRRPPPVSLIPRLMYRSTTTMDKLKGIENDNNNNNNKKKVIFECKDCKKVFNSHQALGGHRASHKKVKGCFAARIDGEYDYALHDNALTSGKFFLTKSTSTLPCIHVPSRPSSSKKKLKMHECSICHRLFSSGQALGGHKRCHWITSNGAAADVPSHAKLASLQGHLERIQQRRPISFINVDHDPLTLELDLNLPVPLMSDARNFDKVVLTEMYLSSWLGFDAKEIRECNNRSAGNNCDVGVKKKNENDIANCGPLADNNNNNNSSSNNLVNVADKEADSKVKLAKLSELNDSKISGNSSSWLQVGIGSMAAKDDAATSAGK